MDARYWHYPACRWRAAWTCLRNNPQSQVARGMDTVTFRQPLGVVAGICPFNFPAMIPMWVRLQTAPFPTFSAMIPP